MKQIVAALVLFTAFAGSARAQSIALVTDLVGKAEGLGMLSEIQAETQVRLQGQLTALYYGSGHEFIFQGPALIRFRAKEPEVIEGSSPQRRTLTATGVTLRSGDISPAAFVMRRPSPIAPPKGTPVSERVAYAVWLEQSGQKQEAARYWKALSAERPDSERLRALAGAK